MLKKRNVLQKGGGRKNMHRDLVESTNRYCDRCDKNFSSIPGWKLHMQKHTGQWAFWCDKCQKGFSVRCNYEAHVAKDEGRTFQCDLCDKRFKSKRGLQMHYTVHKPENNLDSI